MNTVTVTPGTATSGVVITLSLARMTDTLEEGSVAVSDVGPDLDIGPLLIMRVE